MHTFVKVFLELFFIDLFRVFIKYIPYSSTSRGIVTLCNLHLILTFNFFNLICCEGYRHGIYLLQNSCLRVGYTFDNNSFSGTV